MRWISTFLGCGCDSQPLDNKIGEGDQGDGASGAKRGDGNPFESSPQLPHNKVHNIQQSKPRSTGSATVGQATRPEYPRRSASDQRRHGDTARRLRNRRSQNRSKLRTQQPQPTIMLPTYHHTSLPCYHVTTPLVTRDFHHHSHLHPTPPSPPSSTPPSSTPPSPTLLAGSQILAALGFDRSLRSLSHRRFEPLS